MRAMPNFRARKNLPGSMLNAETQAHPQRLRLHGPGGGSRDQCFEHAVTPGNDAAAGPIEHSVRNPGPRHKQGGTPVARP